MSDFDSIAASLDSAITQVQSASSHREELARLRKTTTNLTPELSARLLDLEEILDWRPTSQHLLMLQTVCLSCNSRQMVSAALLTRQEHRRIEGAVRWVRNEHRRTYLPLGEMHVERHSSPICFQCIPLTSTEAVISHFSPIPNIHGAYLDEPTQGSDPTPQT